MAKVLLSLDGGLLRRIDRRVRSQGLSRSAYLRGLAERDLGSSAGPGRRQSARRALSQVDELMSQSPAEDSTAAIRAERDAR